MDLLIHSGCTFLLDAADHHPSATKLRNSHLFVLSLQKPLHFLSVFIYGFICVVRHFSRFTSMLHSIACVMLPYVTRQTQPSKPLQPRYDLGEPSTNHPPTYF